MRFIVRAIIPTEAGNRMVQDPNFISNMENYIKTNKVEADYFMEVGGDRGYGSSHGHRKQRHDTCISRAAVCTLS